MGQLDEECLVTFGHKSGWVKMIQPLNGSKCYIKYIILNVKTPD